MVKADVLKLLTAIAGMYKGFEVNEFKVELWHSLVADMDYQLAQAALRQVMMTSKFPPTVAELRQAAAELTAPQKLNAGEAWGEVTRGIAKFGSYDPEGAYSIMSPMTLKVVKQLSWREICGSENISVTRGQFIKIYDSLKVRDEQEKLLPEGFKDSVKKLADKLAVDKKLLGGGVNGTGTGL